MKITGLTLWQVPLTSHIAYNYVGWKNLRHGDKYHPAA